MLIELKTAISNLPNNHQEIPNNHWEIFWISQGVLFAVVSCVSRYKIPSFQINLRILSKTSNIFRYFICCSFSPLGFHQFDEEQYYMVFGTCDSRGYLCRTFMILIPYINLWLLWDIMATLLYLAPKRTEGALFLCR